MDNMPTTQPDDMQASSEPIDNNPSEHRKILVIEDEPFIGELYTRSLKKAGYEVKVVVDGAEGLQEAQTNAYDIILLDIMVPSITGTELLKKMRAPEATPIKAKIIVTTNLEQNEAARQAVEKQADGYLIKANITPKELVKFLQSI
jgi:CheY-like chemotaxis protein